MTFLTPLHIKRPFLLCFLKLTKQVRPGPSVQRIFCSHFWLDVMPTKVEKAPFLSIPPAKQGIASHHKSFDPLYIVPSPSGALFFLLVYQFETFLFPFWIRFVNVLVWWYCKLSQYAKKISCEAMNGLVRVIMWAVFSTASQLAIKKLRKNPASFLMYLATENIWLSATRLWRPRFFSRWQNGAWSLRPYSHSILNSFCNRQIDGLSERDSCLHNWLDG